MKRVHEIACSGAGFSSSTCPGRWSTPDSVELGLRPTSLELRRRAPQSFVEVSVAPGTPTVSSCAPARRIRSRPGISHRQAVVTGAANPARIMPGYRRLPARLCSSMPGYRRLPARLCSSEPFSARPALPMALAFVTRPGFVAIHSRGPARSEPRRAGWGCCPLVAAVGQGSR